MQCDLLTYPFSKKVLLFCFSLFITVQSVFGTDIEQRTKIDSLKAVIASSKTDTIIAKSMHELGRVYRRVNSDTAFWWLQKLIVFAEKKNLKKYVAKGLMTTANVYRFDKNLDKSKEYYWKALHEFQSIKDTNGVALATGCIMKCFIIMNGSRDSIQLYFDKVIAMRDLIKDQSIIGDAFLDYSSFLINKAEYHLSMSYLMQGIKIYEEIQNERYILPAKLALANIHSLLNNKSKALEIYEEIAPRALKLKSYPLYSTVLIALGDIYLFKKEYNKSQNTYRKGLWLNETYNIRENTDMFYTSMAGLKIELQQSDSAIYFANKALAIVDTTFKDAHNANVQLAKAYIQKKNFSKAKEYIDDFLKYYTTNRNKEFLKEAYAVLSLLYEKKGEYKKAYEYHQLYTNYTDSLYTEENAIKIADMDAWYWGLKKGNELALAKKNEELKTKEVQQARIENELFVSQRNGLIVAIILIILFSVLLYNINMQRRKNKLMQELTGLELKAIRAQMNPHFLFNALSAIQMLINKNDIKQANIGLAKFGKLMRLILENSEKQTISIEDEIKTLELYIELESLRFPFNYKLMIDPLLDTENMEIPAMIIQPYIENAIKHGIADKTDNRNITIQLQRKDQQLFCTVEDNGVGREMAEMNKSKYAQHKSMGTKLSKERLTLISKQISGKADVVIKDLHDNEGYPSGTLVEISIPITYYEN